MRTLATAWLAVVLALATGGTLRAGIGMGTIEEDPSLVRERLMQKCEDDYKEGMKSRAAGDIARAVPILIRVAKMETQITSPYPPKAFEELKVIVVEANRDLQVARQLVAGEDPAAGLSELKRIMRTYMGLGPAKEAGMFLRQLESDPQFQATLKAARLNEDLKKAQALEAQADALLNPASRSPEPSAVQAPAEPVPGPPAPSQLPTTPPPPAKPEGVGVASVTTRELSEKERHAQRAQRLLDAYELYGRIVQQGAATEPAKKAAEARARLEQDADVSALLRKTQAERKARELYGLAESYYKAGRFDTARQQCMKILAECPGTPQAADAKVLLDRMK